MSQIIGLTITLFPGIGHPMFRKFEITPFHVHEKRRRSNADIAMASHTATQSNRACGASRYVGEGPTMTAEAATGPPSVRGPEVNPGPLYPHDRSRASNAASRSR